jgi:hypothetical protein
VQKGSAKVARRVTKTGLVIGIMVLVMAFAATSYAKLVVLSFTFDNDTQGFTAGISGTGLGSCTASPVTSWGSDGTLVVTLAPASGCSGYGLSINKLVVLAAPVPIPNLDMAIMDPSGALNLNGADVSLSSIASPSKLVVLSPTVIGGWTHLDGAWGEQANSGSATLQTAIPFSNGSWNSNMVITINSVELDDGN